jgi:hypothetical protein
MLHFEQGHWSCPWQRSCPLLSCTGPQKNVGSPSIMDQARSQQSRVHEESRLNGTDACVSRRCNCVRMPCLFLYWARDCSCSFNFPKLGNLKLSMNYVLKLIDHESPIQTFLEKSIFLQVAFPSYRVQPLQTSRTRDSYNCCSGGPKFILIPVQC